MTEARSGKDLFIVDNSVLGWTGLRYLEEWCGIARSFDIATGFFEIGSLLALDGKWQGLEKIRILMGAETAARSRRLLLAAVTGRAVAVLNTSLEEEKEANPFLIGVPAVVSALKTRQIECRIYDKEKFHAKAYITHAKLEVVGAQALVGSSNFTTPGLTQNVELNIQVQSGREVAQLQEWFDHYWNDAEDITPEVEDLVARHVFPYTPFDVYAKALHEFFRGHEMTAGEWEESRSQMFPQLDAYQKEAYWALMKIARQHGGAFLCDGVGLGKTFVGLMLIERLIMHEGKRVVVLAPKAAKEAVWEPHIRDWLPHVGGVGGSADFSNLAIFSHTDLSREGDFPERFERIAELADVVVIDEAHHFRNPGSRGNENGSSERSRYYRLFDLLDPGHRPKTLYMLTATPINNRLSDFRHMAELFTRGDEAYFARTIGVNNLRSHFNNLEKSLKQRLGSESVDLGESLTETQVTLADDQIFQHVVVQRSRAYARESQIRENRNAAIFPERRAPAVASYSIRKTYGRLLELVESAFEKNKPLFNLSIYYPLDYAKKEVGVERAFEQNRQKQVVSLIRTQFLKRFESSVAAFELSCDRLMRKLLAFVEVNSETTSEKGRFERWKLQHAEVLNQRLRQLELWGDDEPEDPDEDIVAPELVQAAPKLDRGEYEVGEIIQETMLDLEEIARFLEEARRFDPRQDDKLQKLIRLLQSKDLKDQKVLIFTEFADTARYLFQQLQRSGFDGLAEVDSGSKINRVDVLKRFAPYYNGTSSAELRERGRDEIRILISTDVLSEGLNLQDATRLINYDIHWNPVRLMQRIGRVDRRMNPATEAKMIQDHPELSASRGKVAFWNFLPPDELNELLSLYTRVTEKTLLISKTLGIEGKKLLTPEDDYQALREFNHVYEGTKSAVEEMHLEYQALLRDHPGVAERLGSLPGALFSGRERAHNGARGVFFCYALPALDKDAGEFTEEAGTTRWYLFDLDRDAVVEEPGEIVSSIRSKPETPRHCATEQKTLVEIRATVEKHIKNTYLKRLDAPVGVRPALKCWMELNGD
jgi:superfamily II DNA or RNA helicase